MVKTLTLQEGETLKQNFSNYVEMATSAVDWTIFCTYQLQPNFSEGVQKILQLPTIQIACTKMSGGIMFDYIAPEDCIVFSLMTNISKKASIDQMKLSTGMISIVNDKKIYNFMCSDKVEFYDVSLRKSTHPALIESLNKAIDKYFIDEDQKMATLIKGFVDKYGEVGVLDKGTSIQIENEIVTAMTSLLKKQKPKKPSFTNSEKVAMSIKKKLFKHMDHKITVSSLAKKYNISEKGLQNGFNSLFGITPNQFMRLLKLNLVHHELVQKSAMQSTIEQVAQKWGFSHMGRFSKYYTELFGENPSVTLKKESPFIDGMKEQCVERKEEME
jgi:AraC-like DNA-binding protein